MKLVTFNVHALSGNRVHRIINLLKKLSPHVIFLQEISESILKQVANGMNYKYYWAKAGFLGNGLLSLSNITKSESIILNVGAQCEYRSAIKATIDTLQFGKVKFIGTHLDHLYENNRLGQIKLLFQYIQDVDFIMGDFNSIHVEDYTEKEISEINIQRDIGGVEHVNGAVMNYIKQNGYVINPYVHWTSRFKTRIDFILHKNNKKWVSKETVINTIVDHYSDHCLVMTNITR